MGAPKSLTPSPTQSEGQAELGRHPRPLTSLTVGGQAPHAPDIPHTLEDRHPRPLTSPTVWRTEAHGQHGRAGKGSGFVIQAEGQSLVPVWVYELLAAPLSVCALE